MMKVIMIGALAALVGLPAFAGDNTSGSLSGASSSVNIQSGRSYRGTGAAIAPGLAVGGMSCSGSTSAAAGGPGWGFAFGTTRMDQDCNHRENAKVAGAAFGMQSARRVLCLIDDIRSTEPACGAGVRTRAALPARQRATGYPVRRVVASNGWGQR